MKFLLRSLITLNLFAAGAVAVLAADPGTGKSFQGPVGLQLYSLRAQFAANGAAKTLDAVKGYGIRYAELAGTYNLKPEQLTKLLADRGLPVARRTVAKYREQLGILPSHLRKAF